jgi:hypothetical protein
MFEKPKDSIAALLKSRGLSVENRSPDVGGFRSLFDTEAGEHRHWCPESLRRAILG